MLRKSLKYTAIALVNFILLVALYLLAIGDLKIVLGHLTLIDELMKMLLLFIGVLVAMRVMISVINRRSKTASWKYKFRSAVIVTLILSGYFYMGYATKIYDRFSNEHRHNLIDKIEVANLLAYGSKGERLTYAEYQVLREHMKFPELSAAASHISYTHAYDGFLLDYIFKLTYEVPIEIEVQMVDYKNGSFSKSQGFQIIDDRKLVTYEELG